MIQRLRGCRDSVGRVTGHRDWASLKQSTADYWSEYKRQHGPAAGLRVGDDLRRLVAMQRPDWPSATDRAEDLEVHVRVAEVLARAAPRDR